MIIRHVTIQVENAIDKKVIGYGISAMARKVGISVSYLHDCIKGRRKISLEKYLKIQDILNH